MKSFKMSFFVWTAQRLALLLAVLLFFVPVVSARELPLPETVSPMAEFRLLGCVDPQAAFARYADAQTAQQMRQLGQVLCPGIDATQGWQYFFGSSVATLASLNETRVLSMYYHPWGDVALLCEWTVSDGAPRITSVELVNGDVLRNTKEPVVVPLWRREGIVPPPLAAVIATSDTVRGFMDLYGQRTRWFPERWKGRLPNLRNDRQKQANQAHVGAAFAQSMTGINVFFTEDDFAPVRTAMNHVRQLLLDGRGDKVVELAAETTDESRVVLAEAELDWQEAFVVAVATDVKNAFIFLAGADNPEVFACFWFEMGKDGAAPSLRRVDFLGHTLSFEDVDQIVRDAGIKR